MDDITIQIWIEAYLNGELNGSELQKFEQKMQNDADFATEVAQHNILETMLTSFEIGYWKQRAKTLLEKKKEQAPPTIKPLNEAKPRSGWQYLWRLAAVLLLVAGLAYLFIPDQSIAPEQLAMTYFEQTEASIYNGIERGESSANTDQELLNTAHEQYQQQDYQQATTTLSKILQNSPLYPESTLLIGLCYLHLRQHSQAIQKFQIVANHSNTLSQEEAEWLLALAHLQNRDIETAKTQLQTIQATKGGFSKQAASLLSKL